MRLDKYLGKAINVSRSEAQAIIKKGLVEVNNILIRKKDFYINEDVDKVAYLHQILEYHQFVYYMLNKPQGVVSAVIDSIDKTVVDLIKERKDIFPVGRLDKDTEGLLILTNNGSLAHHLTSPKSQVVKKYYVETKNDISPNDVKAFQEGVYITDGNGNVFLTKPATLEIIDTKSCYVSITEGKFHQIKKMFHNVDNEVEYLKRITMGNIALDESLLVGDYRQLTKNEIIALKVI